MQSSISLVIPVYNEEESIEKTVILALDVLPEINEDFEIVLVDDASQDRTPEILSALSEKYPQIKVITHRTNQKLGASLRDGFAAATKNLVAYTDADLPIDLHDIKRAVRVIQTVDADIVAAYRHDRTSDEWYRIVYTIVYNLLIRVLYRLRIRDVNFAFKVFKREVLEGMTLRSEGSFINAEILTLAKRKGHYICQIGSDYFVRNKGKSTLASLGVIFKIIKEMICLYPSVMTRKSSSHDISKAN